MPRRPVRADVKRAMIEWWGPVIYEFYGSTESGARHLRQFRGCAEASPAPSAGSRPAPSCASSATTASACRRARSAKSIRGSPANPDFTYHNKPEKRAEIERDGFITSGDVGYIDARRLCLHLRPQARHGDLRRRQHLSGRDRGRAACGSRRARLRGVRHPRRGVRRGADGGGRTASQASRSISPMSAPSCGRRWPTIKCRNTSKSRPPAARGFRQDLQAPAARSLLGEGGEADLRPPPS